MVGSSLTFDDKEFNSEIILVEVATPKFTFKYEK